MIYLAIFCIALLLYSYVGFPLLVSLLATLRPREWTIDETFKPTVSIILPAFNEELVLRRCLTSLVQSNYPLEKFEILCGSDGSTDGTNAIINEFADKYPTVRPFFFNGQRGKMLALNDLASESKSEILLFVDADVTLNPNAILHHVRHYADESVGGVAGRLAFAGERRDGVFKSESMFLSIESNLRRSEALVSSTIGLYGGNYSMRRSLWRPLPDARVADDFFTVLTILASGKRLLYEGDAVSTELYGRDYEDEFHRKTRFASRCLYSLTFFPHLLFRGKVAWMIWPHKLLRWGTGFIALGVLVGSIVAYLDGVELASTLVVIEGIAAFLILLGWIGKLFGKTIPIASNLYWFFNMNLAFMKGFYEFAFSKQKVIWSQTARVADTTVPVREREAIHS